MIAGLRMINRSRFRIIDENDLHGLFIIDNCYANYIARLNSLINSK